MEQSQRFARSPHERSDMRGRHRQQEAQLPDVALGVRSKAPGSGIATILD
jgi:hypothetical protein